MAAVRIAESALRSPAFTAALLLALAAAGFSAAMVALMATGLEELLPASFAQMGHFTDLSHRTHDLAFGFLFVPSVAGLVAQFRRPARNVAGMVMALVPPAALLIVLGLTFAVGGNTRVLQPPWVMVMAGSLLAMALHPAGRGFFGSFRLARRSAAMTVLAAIAAVAAVPFASAHVGSQASAADAHAAAGHYGFMAALALTTVGLAGLASLRPDGWRLTAWTAGALPSLLGATSIVYPGAPSSLGLPWALAAIAWGALFAGMAERARRDASRAHAAEAT